MPKKQNTITNYKLSDEAISHIAQTIQIAMLTGTDVIDHLRMIDLVNEDNLLILESSYKENFNVNIEKMVAEAEVLSEESIDITEN